MDSLIKLYPKNTRDFLYNIGIGILNDAVSCKIVEELDDSFTLSMEYPVGGHYITDIQNGNIILAYPNKKAIQDNKPEPFVIVNVSIPLNGVVNVTATHMALTDAESFIVYPFKDDPDNIGYTVGAMAGEIYNASDLSGMLKYASQKIYDGVGGSSTEVDSKMMFDVSDINVSYAAQYPMKSTAKTTLYNKTRTSQMTHWIAYTDDDPTKAIIAEKDAIVSFAKGDIIYSVLNQQPQPYEGISLKSDVQLRQVNGQYIKNVSGSLTRYNYIVATFNGDDKKYYHYFNNDDDALWVNSSSLHVITASESDNEDLQYLFKIDFSSIEKLSKYLGSKTDDDSRWKQTDSTFSSFASSFQCDYKLTYDYDEEKTKVIFYKKRHDASKDMFKIQYASNMIGMTAQIDYSEVSSYVFPYYGSGDEMVHLSERPITDYEPLGLLEEYPLGKTGATKSDIIKIPNTIDLYGKIYPLDLSDEFYDSDKQKTEPTEEELYLKAVKFIKDCSYKIASPKISLEVSFIELATSERYKYLKSMEYIEVGDDVSVTHSDLGIDINARIYSIEYDCLSNSYTKITVGNCRQNDMIEGILNGLNGVKRNERVGLELGNNSVLKSQNVYYLAHYTSETPITEFEPPEQYTDRYGRNSWLTESTDNENAWSLVAPRLTIAVQKYQNEAILEKTTGIVLKRYIDGQYVTDNSVSAHKYTSSSSITDLMSWYNYAHENDFEDCYRIADAGSSMRFANNSAGSGQTLRISDLEDEGMPSNIISAIQNGKMAIGDKISVVDEYNYYIYWHGTQKKYINGFIDIIDIEKDDSLNKQPSETQDLYYYKVAVTPPVVQGPRLLMAAPLMAAASNDDEEYPAAPTQWVTYAGGTSNTWSRRKPDVNVGSDGTFYCYKQSLNIDGSLTGVVRPDNSKEFLKTQTVYIEWTNTGSPSAPDVWVETALPTTGDHTANTWYNSIMELKHDGVRYYCEQTLYTDKSFDNGEVFIDGGGGFVAVQNIYKRITSPDTPTLPNEWIEDSTPGINKWYTSSEKQTYTPGYYTWSAKQYRKSNGEVICKDLDLVILSLDDIQTIFFRSATNSSPTAPTTWVSLNTETSEQWTQYCMKPVSSHPYVWYTSQKKYSDGTVSVGTYQTAGLSDYISETQSIRYRKTTSGAPSVESLEWVTQTSSTVTNEWTRFVLQPESGNHVWEIEQQKHLKSDGSTYLTYSPTSPCLINYITTVQQTLFYVTKGGMPNPPSAWITQVDCVPNAWFDDYTTIPSSPPTDWIIYSSGDTWKNYAFYRCIQNGDQKDGEITSFSSTKVEQICFSEVTALAYAEVFNRDPDVIPPAPSAPTSYSQIYNAESIPTSGRWYNNIPVKVLKKEGYKNIKYYSVSYLYGQNAIGVSYFIPSTVESRDTDNMMVNWCAENDDTKIDGSTIYTENLYAQNVKVYRQGTSGETVFWADGHDNATNPITGQTGRFVKIGNYYVDPETGGLVGTWENAQNTSGIEMYDKAQASKSKTIMTPYKFKVGYMNGQTFVDEARLDMDSLVFEQTLAGVYCNGGILELGGNAVRLAAQFFPGSSVIYSSKPEWTSADVGRVIFVKEQNS